MTRPTLTISQMIDRNNREVRWRRWGQRFDHAAMMLVIATIWAGAALVLALLIFERIS